MCRKRKKIVGHCPKLTEKKFFPIEKSLVCLKILAALFFPARRMLLQSS